MNAGNYTANWIQVLKNNNHVYSYNLIKPSGIFPLLPSHQEKLDVTSCLSNLSPVSSFHERMILGTLYEYPIQMCPILPPVTTHIGKGSVYGTLWQDKWYRCITCKMLDEDNNTEVLFVDFGNKEKRNMSQLVGCCLYKIQGGCQPFLFSKVEIFLEKK